MSNIASFKLLTKADQNVALQLLHRKQSISGAFLNDIVENVLRSYGGNVSAPTRQKLFNYIALLASVGKSPEQLQPLGVAYLREILQPDARYSGC